MHVVYLLPCNQAMTVYVVCCIFSAEIAYQHCRSSDGCLDGHGDRDVVSQACQLSHKVVGFYLLK